MVWSVTSVCDTEHYSENVHHSHLSGLCATDPQNSSADMWKLGWQPPPQPCRDADNSTLLPTEVIASPLSDCPGARHFQCVLSNGLPPVLLVSLAVLNMGHCHSMSAQVDVPSEYEVFAVTFPKSQRSKTNDQGQRRQSFWRLFLLL